MKQLFAPFLLLLLFPQLLSAQANAIKGNGWTIERNADGTIAKLVKGNQSYPFYNDSKGSHGPSWYLRNEAGELSLKKHIDEEGRLCAAYDGLQMSLEYKIEDGRPLVLAKVKNTNPIPFEVHALGLRLGVNSYMDNYPSWEDKLFPTLLRAEKSHLWGYCMSPLGKILVVASPDAIASWNHDYSQSWGDHPNTFGGHRITSINLDLMHALPLPQRHPQDLWRLSGWEEKVFRIYFDQANSLEEVPQKVAAITKAPYISLKQTSVQPGQAIEIEVSNASDVYVFSPDGKRHSLKTKDSFIDTKETGRYQIIAKASNGKTSEALFYVLRPYSWYMEKGIEAVVKYKQKAAPTHCESWYGFYTTYAGARYFPKKQEVAQADSVFWPIMNRVFDTAKAEPHEHGFRIQNTSTLIGMLVDRYQAMGEESDLRLALRMADFLMKSQGESGAYYAQNVPWLGYDVHYTSVIYIAKSLMELLEVLEDKPELQRQYDKIYASVKAAMDDLAKNKTDIETEGEMTFEDGMVSCSALQLARFALMEDNRKDKEKYQSVALELLEQHQCLEQLLIPDSRMRSASLRFWEAQYDVVMTNNFFNSPHGWTAWTVYAQYYAYLLTGEAKYLERTFNGLNTCMQLVDHETGDVHWAFMVNPYLKVKQITRNLEGASQLQVPGVHYNAGNFMNRSYQMGEEYVSMVSDWFFGNANDNDVHEIFKSLEEIALGKAYVIETAPGNFYGYNCTVSLENGELLVSPAEELVKAIHLNLKKNISVSIKSADKTEKKKLKKGMQWVELN